jgi:hypothetical protein
MAPGSSNPDHLPLLSVLRGLQSAREKASPLMMTSGCPPDQGIKGAAGQTQPLNPPRRAIFSKRPAFGTPRVPIGLSSDRLPPRYTPDWQLTGAAAHPPRVDQLRQMHLPLPPLSDGGADRSDPAVLERLKRTEENERRQKEKEEKRKKEKEEKEEARRLKRKEENAHRREEKKARKAREEEFCAREKAAYPFQSLAGVYGVARFQFSKPIETKKARTREEKNHEGEREAKRQKIAVESWNRWTA